MAWSRTSRGGSVASTERKNCTPTRTVRTARLLVQGESGRPQKPEGEREEGGKKATKQRQLFPLPERRLSRSRGRSWGRRAAFFFVKLLLKPSCHLLVVGRRGPSLAHQSDQVRPRHDRNKTLKRISRLLLVGPGQAPEQVQVRRLALDLHIHGRSSS